MFLGQRFFPCPLVRKVNMQYCANPAVQDLLASLAHIRQCLWLANDSANRLTVAKIAHRRDVMTIESYGVEGTGIRAKTAPVAAFTHHMHDTCVLLTLNRARGAGLLAWRVAAMPAEVQRE